MSPLIKKLVIFTVLTLLTAVLDLWSKEWARNSLATFEHPLVLKSTRAQEGKPLSDLLPPGSDASSVLPLFKPLETSAINPKAAVYPVERITWDRGYYVFLSPDRSSSPLFLPNPALEEYQHLARQGFSMEQWRSKWKGTKLPWSKLLSDSLPRLSQSEISFILENNLIHPIPMSLPKLSPSTPISVGETYLLTNRTIEIIPGALRLIYAENPGGAWGILRNAPPWARTFFLRVMTVIAMGVIIYVVWRTPSQHLLSIVALSMIMGGAIGNFYDRFGKDAVVDFIDMYISTHHWPSYNVADIGITVGVGLLLIQVLRKKSPI